MKSINQWLKFTWINLRCMCGFHQPGCYRGKIHVKDVDKASHQIVYGNIRECDNCGAPLSVDYW
jgi:hypothetical protein